MAFIRESRRARALPRVGPFALLVTQGTRLRFLNYAIPDDDADPEDSELDALVAAFRTADRMPRVEFLPSVAPALEPRLTARGWTVEDRLPLMTYTETAVRHLPAPDGIVVDAPSDDATLLEMARLQHEVFDDPEPADARTVGQVAQLACTRRARARRPPRRDAVQWWEPRCPGRRPAARPRLSAWRWRRPTADGGSPLHWCPRSRLVGSTQD